MAEKSSPLAAFYIAQIFNLLMIVQSTWCALTTTSFALATLSWIVAIVSVVIVMSMAAIRAEKA